ncbi:MAG: hypothetical protein ABI333_27625 [bacterium]
MIWMTLSLAMTLVVAGCGGTTFVNKKYRSKLAGSPRVLIMPAVAHRFPTALRRSVQKLLNTEINGAFSQGGVRVDSIQEQLFPGGYGNLGWRLAVGMYYRAKVKDSPKLEGDYYDWLDDMGEHTQKFAKWVGPALAKAGVTRKAHSYRYVLASYVDRLKTSKTKQGKTLVTLRVMVGIFDVQKKRTVACLWKNAKIEPTFEKIRPILKGLGDHIRTQFQPVLQ